VLCAGVHRQKFPVCVPLLLLFFFSLEQERELSEVSE
jgi:hypothetical protein